MIRIVLLNLLLLLLPTILYLGYTHLTSAEPSKGFSILEDAPLTWLLLAGSVLAVATMVFFGTPPSGKPGDAYRPPIFRDGKIIPGHLGDETLGEGDASKR